LRAPTTPTGDIAGRPTSNTQAADRTDEALRLKRTPEVNETSLVTDAHAAFRPAGTEVRSRLVASMEATSTT
jgi:hypothetical protein